MCIYLWNKSNSLYVWCVQPPWPLSSLASPGIRRATRYVREFFIYSDISLKTKWHKSQCKHTHEWSICNLTSYIVSCGMHLHELHGTSISLFMYKQICVCIYIQLTYTYPLLLTISQGSIWKFQICESDIVWMLNVWMFGPSQAGRLSMWCSHATPRRQTWNRWGMIIYIIFIYIDVSLYIDVCITTQELDAHL
jgi:hypothetical protein